MSLLIVTSVFSRAAATRSLNESCGGQYGFLGRCAEGFRCTADEEDFLDGEDIQGVCYRRDGE